MKRALLSVSDKTGIVEFAKKLIELDFEIISTGNTRKELIKYGINSISVEEITNFPEILDGRVKTLHPAIHSAILCDYGKEEHTNTLAKFNIAKIDLVYVNLYPFEETLKTTDNHSLLIEKIDIGGPTLIRAAAKNYKNIIVCTKPEHAEFVLDRLQNNGNINFSDRQLLAKEAFKIISHYDVVISNYFNNIDNNTNRNKSFSISFDSEKKLRYGLNPFQKSTFYYDSLPIKQLQGKELSYNNFLDIDAILKMLNDFSETVCIAVKHLNPCAISFGNNVLESYINTYNCDNISIFGGIIGVKKEVDKETAIEMCKTFLEVIVAPSYTEEALQIFKQKENLRILTYNEINTNVEIRSVLGGILVQDCDSIVLTDKKFDCVTDVKIPEKIYNDIIFADTVCKHMMSNAIAVVKNMKTVGLGIGQTNRVLSAKIALEQAKDKGETENLILSSDAFLPFDDTVKLAKKYGVKYIVQPGGSVRDEEVIKTCNDLGIGMIFTGTRHFKH